MPWVRFDDQFPIHRKIIGLTDRRYRIATEAIFWCARTLSDGVVRLADLSYLCIKATRRDASDLVSRQIWHEAGTTCPSPACPPPGPDGWVIHDYWEYQPPKEQVERERAAKAERQKRWREARKRGPVDASRDASRDALLHQNNLEQTGRVDASRDASPIGNVDPTPPPPRPETSGAGEPAPGRVPPARRRADGHGGRQRKEPKTTPTPSETKPLGQRTKVARKTLASVLGADSEERRDQKIEGLGFCIVCYSDGGKTTVAEDPQKGSHCKMHRETERPKDG